MPKSLLAVERDLREQQDEPDDICRCTEFPDGFYQCPACREWQQQTKARLDAEARPTGDVPEEPLPW